jgi:filamentous hemagglutinin family protein
MVNQTYCYGMRLVWIALLVFYPLNARSQIVGDGTLGTQVNGARNLPCSGNCTITNGTLRGGNLFHSFQQFSMRNRTDIANFQTPAATQNVFLRITGIGQSFISNINGRITTNGNANFFVLNPNGIILGRDARLDIRGSFIASTADQVIFADNTIFSTNPAQTSPLLTILAPIGLNFTNPPSQIVVQGNSRGSRRSEDPVIDPNQAALRVAGDRTLALVGGELLLEGATLKTAGGRIELGAVGSVGIVRLNPTTRGFGLDYAGIPSLGNIRLTQAASVDASGDRGGDIQIQGRQIQIQDGSQVESSTLATASGGNLQVNATESLEVSGTSADAPQAPRLFPSSLSTDNRRGGEIPGELRIETKRLIVRNGARISASNSTTGVGGNLTVNASDSVLLSGTGISQGGLRSSGLSVQTRGSGKAGVLTINTGQLRIQDGAEASASTFSTGDGGDLKVTATQIIVSGTSPNQALRSRLVAEVGNLNDVSNTPGNPNQTPATGQGGNLLIVTDRLLVQDGGTLNVSSRSEAPDARGAGEINLTARTIQLNNRGQITAESRSGAGGDIKLTIGDGLLLRRNSLISATAGTAQRGGDGGNITLNALQGFIVGVRSENSDITANAFSGRGGEVRINAQGIYQFTPRSRTELIQLLNTTNPTQLNPQRLQSNDITAISQGNPNLDGVVAVTTPDIDPSRGLVPLPIALTDPSNQIDRTCAARTSVTGSHFTVSGHGGLPAQPSDMIGSQQPISRLVKLDNAAAKQQTMNRPNPIVEAQTATRLENGKIRLRSPIVPQNVSLKLQC